MNYLSGQYLIDPAGPNFKYVWPALIFFVMGMLATSYAYFIEESNNKRAPITRNSRRIQTIAWTLAVVGLILIGFRVGDAQIPLVGSRLILYLIVLGFVALAAYLVWFLRYQLPVRNQSYETSLLRRQYQPRSRRRR